MEHLSQGAIETIAQIILAVIVLIASGWGIRLGFGRSKGTDDEVHEIKGAIISDKKAEEIIRFMEENTRSNMALVAAIHELREAVKDAKQDVRDIIREFREDLRYMLQMARR